MDRIMEEKQRFMKRWNERADYSGMLRVIYEDDHSHGEDGHHEEVCYPEKGGPGDSDDQDESPDGENIELPPKNTPLSL